MFEMFKLLSFMQAKEEGKLPQWFLKQFLLWGFRVLVKLPFVILCMLVRCLVIRPVARIWQYTEDMNGKLPT